MYVFLCFFFVLISSFVIRR